MDRSDLYTWHLVCRSFCRDLFNEPNSTDRLVLLNPIAASVPGQRSDFVHTPGADIERCHHPPEVEMTRGVEGLDWTDFRSRVGHWLETLSKIPVFAGLYGGG